MNITVMQILTPPRSNGPRPVASLGLPRTNAAPRAAIAMSQWPEATPYPCAFWRSILSDPNCWARFSDQIKGVPGVGAAMQI